MGWWRRGGRVLGLGLLENNQDKRGGPRGK